MTTFSVESLPFPRLELRWVELKSQERGYRWLCKYELVFLLPPYDIRNKRKQEYNGVANEKRLRMGGTYSDARKIYWEEHDKIDTPWRDGVHIGYDAHHLHMPAYVVYGDKAMFLDPKIVKYPREKDKHHDETE